MRRPAALVLLAMVVLAGCPTKKPPPDATATTSTTIADTTASTQPTTTTTVNLSAQATPVQLQDPAYWNAILAALNRVVGDAFRSAASARTVEPSAVDALREVYGPALFEDERNVLIEVAAGRGNGLIIPPGDAVATVSGVMRSSARCVALSAALDYGKVNPTVPTSNVVLKLLPRQNSHEGAVNRTSWTIDELYVIGAPDDGGRLCAD